MPILRLKRKICSKGILSIPKEILDSFDWKTGDYVFFELTNNKSVVIRKVDEKNYKIK